MNRKMIAALLAVAMLFTLACGIVETLTGGGANSVSNLWPDVPLMDGASKADTDLPVPVKLAVQAVFQGRLEFTAYTSGKTPQDVQNFYTTERMQAAGWNSDAGGCSGANVSSGAVQGVLCFFGKKEEGKDLGLAIIATQDEKTKQTNIFYVRIDVTSTPAPGT